MTVQIIQAVHGVGPLRWRSAGSESGAVALSGRIDYGPTASGRTTVEAIALKPADRLPWSPVRASMHYDASSANGLRTVFDTLRFADRLKQSGFENRQAEGMARAIGDEMTTLLEQVVTKPDLDSAIGGVRSDVAAVDVRLSAGMDALSAKVDALAAQVRFIMAILVVLLALGLVDTVPRIMG